jgi:hypothetical protein
LGGRERERERERSVLQSSFKMTSEACFCNENHLLIFCTKTVQYQLSLSV